MKKFMIFVAAAITLLLAACKPVDADKDSNLEIVPPTGWIDNLEHGKKLAKAFDKDILLYFSAVEQDEISSRLNENAFMQVDFINTLLNDFILVNLDFSEKLFEAAKAAPDASEEEQAAAKALSAKLDKNIRLARLYSINGTPTFFILSKEGYVVKSFNFFEMRPDFNPYAPEAQNAKVDEIIRILSKEEILAQIEAAKTDVADFNAKVAKAWNGTKDERIEAINAIFDSSDFQHQYFLTDLSKALVKLDKDNASNTVGKHLIAIANAETIDALLAEDFVAASKISAKVAKNKFLTPDEKQLQYYSAGYMLTQSGSTDYPAIKKYFVAAYDANPESENAEQIKSLIAKIDEKIQEASAPKNKAPENTAPASSAAEPEEPAATVEPQPAEPQAKE